MAKEPLEQHTVREYCLRMARTPSGAYVLVVGGRSSKGSWEIDRAVSTGRAFTPSEVELVFASLRDAAMRELVVTQGVQLQIDDLD